MQQEVAEIGGIEHLEAFLISDVKLLALAAREARGFSHRNLVRQQSPVFPAVDQVGKYARRPALLVDILRHQQLLEQPVLITGIEDSEVGLEPDYLGVAAQNFCADGMEGAKPRHSLDGLA